jgi:hypothetical protein
MCDCLYLTVLRIKISKFGGQGSWHSQLCIKSHKIGGAVNMPVSEDTFIDKRTNYGKLQEAAKQRNALAMANFTMAFSTEATIGIVASLQGYECGMA